MEILSSFVWHISSVLKMSWVDDLHVCWTESFQPHEEIWMRFQFLMVGIVSLQFNYPPSCGRRFNFHSPMLWGVECADLSVSLFLHDKLLVLWVHLSFFVSVIKTDWVWTCCGNSLSLPLRLRLDVPVDLCYPFNRIVDGDPLLCVACLFSPQDELSWWFPCLKLNWIIPISWGDLNEVPVLDGRDCLLRI